MVVCGKLKDNEQLTNVQPAFRSKFRCPSMTELVMRLERNGRGRHSCGCVVHRSFHVG